MNKFCYLPSALLLILNSMAFAGTETHGGSSIVCRDRRGSIISTQLTDSYEQSQSSLLPEDTEENQVYHVALDRLHFRPDIQIWFRATLGQFQSLAKRSETPLSRINDLGRTNRLPNRCEYRQLAIFDGTRILIDPELYFSLPLRDRAALFIHEAVYYISRNFKNSGITDSSWARKVTGELISQTNITKADDVLQETLEEISFHLSPGTYRLGECRIDLSFNCATSVLTVKTKKVESCVAYGITENEIPLKLNWKTGEYFSRSGLHLVPGDQKFTLGEATFKHSGLSWSGASQWCQ